MYVRYLNGQTRARLATIGADGSPQNKPVGYHYNPTIGTIDIAGFNMERSAKCRNVGSHPQVALVIDDAIGEGASGMRFLEIRGPAEQVKVDSPQERDLGASLIRIHPIRLVSLNVDPDRPGLQTHDVIADAGSPAGSADRPALDARGPVTGAAEEAIAGLVAELQAGWDQHDADVSNRHFAADVLWGSPFGATVHTYDELHAIHVRLKQQGRGGPTSRFDIVKILAPAPDLAVAQVKRVALDADGEPTPPTDDTSGPFSEMALGVLVRRDGTWWLAAGQNTPIRPAPPS